MDILLFIFRPVKENQLIQVLKRYSLNKMIHLGVFSYTILLNHALKCKSVLLTLRKRVISHKTGYVAHLRHDD